VLRACAWARCVQPSTAVAVMLDRAELVTPTCRTQAAIAHETGHLLGFGHPDVRAAENIEEPSYAAAMNAMDASTISDAETSSALLETCINATSCLTPFASCAVFSHYRLNTTDPSIMQSLTQHAPSTCLSQSDLAGLRALYPVCDMQLSPEVICVKAKRNSGWLRLLVATLLPLTVAIILVMVPLHFIRHRETRKLRQLSDENRRMAKRVASLRTSFARAVAAVTRPSSARPTSGAYGGVRPSSARAMLASAVSSARGFLASRGGSARGTSNTSHSTCRVVPSAQGGDGGVGGAPQLLVISEEVEPAGTQRHSTSRNSSADPRADHRERTSTSGAMGTVSADGGKSGERADRRSLHECGKAHLSKSHRHGHGRGPGHGNSQHHRHSQGHRHSAGGGGRRSQGDPRQPERRRSQADCIGTPSSSETPCGEQRRQAWSEMVQSDKKMSEEERDKRRRERRRSRAFAEGERLSATDRNSRTDP